MAGSVTNAKESAVPGWRDLLAKGNASEALKYYLFEDTPDPNTKRALEALADIQGRLREKAYLRAQKSLERLEARPPFINWQLLEQALKQLEESNHALERKRSEDALAKLATMDQTLVLAEVETQRGTAYIFENDLAQAKAAFDRALEHDPRHYRALTNLGNLALEAGNIDRAIDAYERALKINDDFANAHHNLGVAYRRKGMIGKSVQALRRAQRATQRKDREDARERMAASSAARGAKMLRWLVYGGFALLIYVLLRNQGIL